jgi:hypothetical protein
MGPIVIARRGRESLLVGHPTGWARIWNGRIWGQAVGAQAALARGYWRDAGDAVVPENFPGVRADRLPAPVLAYEKPADQADGPHDCVDSDNTGKCEKCGHSCADHPMAMAVTPRLARVPAPALANAPATKAIGVNAVLAVEGFDTGDGRILDVDGWNTESRRMLPLPLWVQGTQSMFGHEGAVAVGTWDSMERLGDGRRIFAKGTIPLISDDAKLAVEQIRNRVLRFVSIDVGANSQELEAYKLDVDGYPVEGIQHITQYEIMGATVCGHPAVAWAVAWLDGMDAPEEFTAELPPVPERVVVPEVVLDQAGMPPITIMASAPLPTDPPEAWFQPSELHAVLAEQVARDGAAPHVRVYDGHRVVGYVAPWGVCHIGMPGCVTAPRSRAEYAYFATQEALARCCEGCDDANPERRIPAGVLTMGTTHADLALAATEARYHYDHSGHAVARVATGEDEFGIWIAGVVLPGIEPERVALLNGSNISGDWRMLRGGLELVAALVCNVPGFPMVRPATHYARAASGLVQTALVGPVWPGVTDEALAASAEMFAPTEIPTWQLHRRLRELEAWRSSAEAELRRLRAITTPLAATAAEALAATIKASKLG